VGARAPGSDAASDTHQAFTHCPSTTCVEGFEEAREGEGPTVSVPACQCTPQDCKG
jgi:hypothetical protein